MLDRFLCDENMRVGGKNVGDRNLVSSHHHPTRPKMTTLKDLESPSPHRRNFLVSDSDEDGTASQRSIPLYSPPESPRHSAALTSIPLADNNEHGSNPFRRSKDTDFSSEAE